MTYLNRVTFREQSSITVRPSKGILVMPKFTATEQHVTPSSCLLTWHWKIVISKSVFKKYSTSFNGQLLLRCIELEPGFVKAYLRKAKVHAGIGQSSKAMAAYEKALELDPNCAEAIEGYKSSAIQVGLMPMAKTPIQFTYYKSV